jgi:hypothetical protein
LELGMRLGRIHRVMEYKQKAWMQPYVELCTEKRKRATSDFHKDFWKLCVNAVYGKSMEDVRKHVNVRLINDRVAGIKAASKPTFVCSKIINEDLVMVQNAVKTLRMTKPIYTGFTILELSKTVMYEFHYRHIVKRYGSEKARLLFTDTDSLCYHITTPNLYEDMRENVELYDTSNFEPDHFLYSTATNRVLGKFKSETGSKAPLEFVGLRAKMYSLLVGEDNKMTTKGIKKTYAMNHIRHRDFVNTLITRDITYATFRTFGTTNQQLHTLEINKVCLSAYDDKRYIRDDGRSSYAYGHKDIQRQQIQGESKKRQLSEEEEEGVK